MAGTPTPRLPLSAVLVVGAGCVGRRAALQLAETPGIESVLVADRSRDRAAAAVTAIGKGAKVVQWSTGDALPDGVAAVACALPSRLHEAAARSAIDVGVPFASCADTGAAVAGLLDLSETARDAGVALAVGCGMAPGLADVLVRHAAESFDSMEEIRVARAGVAGEECRDSLAEGWSGQVEEWRDGRWADFRGGSGRELVWFPEPVGAHDCGRVGLGQTRLLVDAFEGVSNVSTRASVPTGPGALLGRLPFRLPVPDLPKLPKVRLPKVKFQAPGIDDDAWAGVWVEVRGRSEGRHHVVVYGAVDRMSIAAGATLGITAAWLAGADLPFGDGRLPGAHGLATLVDPVGFLAELATRGVKTARFTGTNAG